ncbi:MAG: TlpA disulfide reductase family protein [Acidobacteriota bacterium]
MRGLVVGGSILVIVVIAALMAVRAGLDGRGAGADPQASPPGVAAPVSGDPLAIDFDAVELDGRPFHGRELKGRVVLLDFWAVWCGPCVDAFPKLNHLADDLRYASFELVGVALYSGDHEAVGEFLEEYAIDYKVVVGEEDLAFRYGVIGYPTYLLLDPDGNIYKRYVGALPTLEERVKADVADLTRKYGLDS